jgi:acyl-coenzyme A thioesterase PaaI-like protein
MQLTTLVAMKTAGAEAVAQMNGFLPFLRQVGVQFVSLTPVGSVTRLPERGENGNGHGSIYAGALTAVGEAATLAALQGLLVPRYGVTPPSLRAIWVRYRRPAHGDLTARGRVVSDHDDALRALAAEGKADITAAATIEDESGAVVAEVSADYQVRVAPDGGGLPPG